MRAGAPIQPFGAFFGSPFRSRPAGHTQEECPGRDTYRGCRPVIITGRAPDTTTVRPVPTGIELVIIGGGNMGAALVGGLLAGGRPPSSIAVTEVAPACREQLAAMLPDVHVSDDVAPCAAAVLAVKPAVVAEAARAAVAAGARRLLSIAAGITTTHIEQAIDGVADEAVAVVRAMPNTPALVGRGASAIAPGAAAGADDLAWAEAILGAVGLVVRVDESQLDAVTALSGSGPAYLFLVAEALTAAGVAVGLAPELAETLDDATARRLRRSCSRRVAIRPACAPRSRHPGARPRPGSPCSSRAACRRSSKPPCVRRPPAVVSWPPADRPRRITRGVFRT